MASKHHVVEVYPDGVNEWRWRLKARNGTVLGDSGQAYRTVGEAESAAELAFGSPFAVMLRTKDRVGKVRGHLRLLRGESK